ncbi:MAG: hypothetical protein GQ523_06030 [Methanophagales archaeon]|jgi:hypothetical protein|nr:hypothetical protein [Methanophagales archaeon]
MGMNRIFGAWRCFGKNTGIDPTKVLKCLNGTGWFGAAKSLLNQGVVE